MGYRIRVGVWVQFRRGIGGSVGSAIGVGNISEILVIIKVVIFSVGVNGVNGI